MDNLGVPLWLRKPPYVKWQKKNSQNSQSCTCSHSELEAIWHDPSQEDTLHTLLSCSIHGAFLSHGGTPSYHLFRTMGSSLTKTNHCSLGVPPWLWKSPHIRLLKKEMKEIKKLYESNLAESTHYQLVYQISHRCYGHIPMVWTKCDISLSMQSLLHLRSHETLMNPMKHDETHETNPMKSCCWNIRKVDFQKKWLAWDDRRADQKGKSSRSYINGVHLWMGHFPSFLYASHLLIGHVPSFSAGTSPEYLRIILVLTLYSLH